MAYTLLSHPLFVEAILPFLLVFTLVFAVLQKTEILGKGKRQIDALVAFVIGLIVISFGYATGVIISVIPFLAVAVVVILVFMLLYGMAFTGRTGDEFKLSGGVKMTIGILAAVGVVIATLVATGGWDYLSDLFTQSGNGPIWLTNIVFVAIVAIAVAVVIMGGKDKKDSKP
jgi:uncharacterized membrane protein